MKKRWLFLLMLIPIASVAQVKNIGTPKIQNYSKSDYNAGTQNWNISQDAKGFMYFANNDGILRFDGFNWELLDTNIPLPVRSVYVDSNGNIFVGLIDNFGVLELNNSGNYNFKSLRYLLDEDVGFSDIWKIHETNQGIVFQAFEKLLIYDRNKIRVYSPKEKYRFSFNVNGRLLVQEHEQGLYEFFNGDFEKVPWAEPLRDLEILSIEDLGEKKLLIGTSEGLFRYDNGILVEWECETNDFVKTNKLFSASSILGNHLAFGTILNGVVISDINGNIVQVLNRNNGLQNNTILSIYADNNKNLWLGLDNGIDYVGINSPISYVSQGGAVGTGYCCIIHKSKLYLGTNQGLFVKSFNVFSDTDENFKLIENTEGQVWSLGVHDNQLICGHNLGTFVIENEEARMISKEPGGWKYIQSKKDPNILFGGFYSGLAIFKKGENGWYFHKKLKGFRESSRFINEDENGYFWVSHGSKGIFRLSLDEKLDSITEYKFYNHNSGLPSGEQNILFSFDGQEYVSAIDGIYKYDVTIDQFSKEEKLNELFSGTGRLKTVQTDNVGNIWFVGEKRTGVLRLNEDLTYTKITAPFEALSEKFVKAFEFVYPYNDDHVFFPIDIGFAHYSSRFSKSYTDKFETFITKVELSDIDSVLNPLEMKNDVSLKFPFEQSSFRFHYASPFYENLSELQFSFKLEHYSDEWSEWTKDSYKDFTNLHEGEYHFLIKAKNIYGIESEICEFRFVISPPWYRSKIAYYSYFLLFVVFVLFLVKFVLYKIAEAKKREIVKHEIEIKEKEKNFQHQAIITEKEIIKLRNEKLRAEMIHRDKELANQTNNILQKNKFLMKLNQELQKIQNTTNDGTVKSKMAILKKRIDKEIDSEDQNRIFETYFEEVHNDFFERLKNSFPNLSPKDLKLCAYIRMNISTKEIATLLNISSRGVEISRYRLRKKMELSREINLSTFLAGI